MSDKKCSVCDDNITDKVYSYSMEKFKNPICYDCQQTFGKEEKHVIDEASQKAADKITSDSNIKTNEDAKKVGNKIIAELGKLEASPQEVEAYTKKNAKEFGESKPMMKDSIQKESIIDLQGKKYVTHAGLLEMTHKLGIKSVNTDIISDLNSETIICKTTLVLKDERVFTGLGDANKDNAKGMVLPHKIRLAETRSFNRAMRFATNTGMCSEDEL
jgi:uncharacterized membrane-anchored protein YjiN (DUF445 family)